MLYKKLHQLSRAMFENWYFSFSRAKWTDDPGCRVVRLRNQIVDLIEGRITEVTGATTAEEIYLLAPGNNQYTLTRICAKKIVEGTYFKQEDPLIFNPRFLEIRGNPYRITQKASPQNSEISLQVEDLSHYPG